MPVHYMSKTLRIQPISSPLATQIPHAAGAAYALKVLGEKVELIPKAKMKLTMAHALFAILAMVLLQKEIFTLH